MSVKTHDVVPADRGNLHALAFEQTGAQAIS